MDAVSADAFHIRSVGGGSISGKSADLWTLCSKDWRRGSRWRFNRSTPVKQAYGQEERPLVKKEEPHARRDGVSPPIASATTAS
jgi:hypothetical protein